MVVPSFTVSDLSHEILTLSITKRSCASMYKVAVAVELTLGVLLFPPFELFVVLLFVLLVVFVVLITGVEFTRAANSFGLPLSNGLSPWGELIAYTWKV